VKAGDLLLDLDPAQAAADEREAREALQAGISEIARRRLAIDAARAAQRAGADNGAPLPALEALAANPQGKIDWGEPASYAGARALMARLDSRPSNRDLAGKVAHRLPDLRIYERMHQSLADVAPGDVPSSQADFAAFAGDKALREKTAALPQLRPCDRIHITAKRVDLGLVAPQAGMREMATAALADQEGARGLLCLIGVLENVVHADKIEAWKSKPGGDGERSWNIVRALSKDPNGAIVRLARKWLAAHPDPRGLDGAAVRGSLFQRQSWAGVTWNLRAILPMESPFFIR